jgi:hypothetical protein
VVEFVKAAVVLVEFVKAAVEHTELYMNIHIHRRIDPYSLPIRDNTVHSHHIHHQLVYNLSKVAGVEEEEGYK